MKETGAERGTIASRAGGKGCNGWQFGSRRQAKAQTPACWSELNEIRFADERREETRRMLVRGGQAAGKYFQQPAFQALGCAVGMVAKYSRASHPRRGSSRAI